MAIIYLPYSPQSVDGKYVQQITTALRTTRNLTSYLQTFAEQINGDPSNVANYTFLANALGCTDTTTSGGTTANETAKAIFDELNSLNFKLTTDTAVTDVNAAINQALSKLLV